MEQELYPCIHFIGILHERKEYYRVADYINSCYYRESIKNSACLLKDGWKDKIQNLDSSSSPNVDQYKDIKFSFWHAITSITKRIPSRGEDILCSYKGIQGRKLVSHSKLNK